MSAPTTPSGPDNDARSSARLAGVESSSNEAAPAARNGAPEFNGQARPDTELAQSATRFHPPKDGATPGTLLDLSPANPARDATAEPDPAADAPTRTDAAPPTIALEEGSDDAAHARPTIPIDVNAAATLEDEIGSGMPPAHSPYTRAAVIRPGTQAGPDSVTLRVQRLHGITTNVELPEPATRKKKRRPSRYGRGSTADPSSATKGGTTTASGKTVVPDVPRYVVGDEIARGGMGAIHTAEDGDIGRQVAMKVLLPEHRNRRLAVSRFLKEAQVTGQLEHPNIVPLYDIGLAGTAADRLYYTMKFVHGRTLADLLFTLRVGDQEVEDSFHMRRLLGVFVQVSNAIAFAHSRGVLHRDIKPENVMVGDYGEVLVMDWGLAKLITPVDADAKPATRGPSVTMNLRQADPTIDADETRLRPRCVLTPKAKRTVNIDTGIEAVIEAEEISAKQNSAEPSALDLADLSPAARAVRTIGATLPDHVDGSGTDAPKTIEEPGEAGPQTIEALPSETPTIESGRAEVAVASSPYPPADEGEDQRDSEREAVAVDDGDSDDDDDEAPSTDAASGAERDAASEADAALPQHDGDMAGMAVQQQQPFHMRPTVQDANRAPATRIVLPLERDYPGGRRVQTTHVADESDAAPNLPRPNKNRQLAKTQGGSSAVEQSVFKTLEGTVVGTPTYMAPEQARGELDHLGARADVYALGAMLYEILTLYPPYDGGSAWEVLGKVIAPDVKPERPTRKNAQRSVPTALENICLKAMAHNPDDRYATVDALRDDVQSYLDGRYQWVAPDKPWHKIGRMAGIVGVMMAPVLVAAQQLVPDFNVARLFDLRALLLLCCGAAGLVWMRFGLWIGPQAFVGTLGPIRHDRRSLYRYAAFWRYVWEVKSHMALTAIVIMLITAVGIGMVTFQNDRAPPPSLLLTLMGAPLYAMMGYILFYLQQVRIEKSMQWVGRISRVRRTEVIVLILFVAMADFAMLSLARTHVEVKGQPLGVLYEPYFNWLITHPIEALTPWSALGAVISSVIVILLFFPPRDFIEAARLWLRNKKPTTALDRRNYRYSASVLRVFGTLACMLGLLYAMCGYLIGSQADDVSNTSIDELIGFLHRSGAPALYGFVVWLLTAIWLPRRLLTLAGTKGEDVESFNAMVKAGLADLMGGWARLRAIAGTTMIVITLVGAIVWIAHDIMQALSAPP